MKKIEQFNEQIIDLHHPGEQWLLMLAKQGDDYGAMLDTLSLTSTDRSVTTLISRSAFYLYVNNYERPTKMPKTLRAEKITEDIKARLERTHPVVVGIVGRSGSGKSTLAREVAKRLRTDNIETQIVSTDDYNRGQKELLRLTQSQTWTNWDAPIVYDTETLAWDLRKLRAKKAVPNRHFNFETNEPEILSEKLGPSDVIIVEGIMANSPDLAGGFDLFYEIPTPVATCIGRRVLRDIHTDRASAMGGSAGKVLKYQLEVAEPEYRRRLK